MAKVELRKEWEARVAAFRASGQYCLNQWDKLVVFLQDGRLELDNNRSLSTGIYNPQDLRKNLVISVVSA